MEIDMTRFAIGFRSVGVESDGTPPQGGRLILMELCGKVEDRILKYRGPTCT